MVNLRLTVSVLKVNNKSTISDMLHNSQPHPTIDNNRSLLSSADGRPCNLSLYFQNVSCVALVVVVPESVNT